MHSMEPSSAMYDPSMYPISSHDDSVYPSATMVDPSMYPTIGYQSIYPSQSLNDPSMYPTIGYESTHSSESYQDPSVYPSASSYHSTEWSPMAQPSVYPSANIEGTQSSHTVYPSATMSDPSVYPTVGYQSIYPSQSFNDPSMYPTIGYESTHSSESYQDPSIYPTQSMSDPSLYPTAYFHETESMHTTEHFQSTMNSEPFDLSEPSMPEPTVGSGCEPQMHATFYFTLSLYDDIDDIQSVELEREFTEELAGQWVTDPEMVYDEDGKAVGVTFNAEVTFDADKGIQFAPGAPMAAVVYDTVATLLKEDMSDSEEKNDNFENKVMNRAVAINDKRVFEINVFVPMMIVFVAVGTIFVCAAKLYSAYLERKEYEPLL